MDKRYEEIKFILKKYNQEQLLNHYEELEENKQKELLREIENIDFDLINSLYANTKKEISNNQDEITYYEKNDITIE